MSSADTEDGLVQTIHYFVTKPEGQALADLGHFLATKQWFVDPQDPFRRSPSFMTYDREENKIVMQDKERGAYVVPLATGTTWVDLAPR